jgi:hypothetical protein
MYIVLSFDDNLTKCGLLLFPEMTYILAIVICLCALVHSQESDSNSTSASLPAPQNISSHGDVQILYTDEFTKVIEKYGITADDIMLVTNKYKEGNPPTVTKMVKNTETGEEEVCRN